MSTPTRSPINHPPYGGEGQARAPRYNVNDLVHVLAAPAVTTASPSVTPSEFTTPSKASPFKAPSSAQSTPSKALPTSTAHQPRQQQQQQPLNEFTTQTIWAVKNIDPSSSSSIEHVYHLEPTTTVHTTAPESRLVAIRFLPGDIVQEHGILCQVQEVKFVKNHAGEVVLRYAVKDELHMEKVLDDAKVEEDDKKEWFPMRD